MAVTTKKDDSAQSQRFIDMAQEIDTGEGLMEFEEAFKRVASDKHSSEGKKKNSSKTTDRS